MSDNESAGLDLLLCAMFTQSANVDTMNITSMVRNELQKTKTEEEIDEIITKCRPTIARKVGEYIYGEYLNYPYTTPTEATASRKRVKNEIVERWANERMELIT